MKISYNWLKELLPRLTHSPEEVADILTLHSFETIVAGNISLDPAIRIVSLEKIEPHPKADRLRLATVTDGKETVTVVCGAPNIREGMLAPFSPPGAVLVAEAGNRVKVSVAKIRGVSSPGMLNSLRELGLHHEHAGIWELPDEVKVGASLSEYMPEDVILDADITPNRAHDALSHLGIARELAALLRLEIKEPTLPALPRAQAQVAGWSVAIEDERLCPRYAGVVVANIGIKPSPMWLQARLLSVGGKPISNAVDITNYVMFELGNPTHLFDQKELPGKDITIRPARRGDTITTLDEARRELSQDDLLITAANQPVALAGVMGGLESGVDETTRRGFLEAANFNAYSIQETSRRHGLRSESSARFSKGLDPNLVEPAARRAAGLLAELAGAHVVGWIDVYLRPVTARTIAYDPDHAAKVAGIPISKPQVKEALQQLRMEVDDSVSPWQVRLPTDRLDILISHDLAEEIIRVKGFDSIIPAAVRNDRPTPLPTTIYWREVVRDTLVTLGFTETYNYAFAPASYTDIAGMADREHLKVINPPAPDLAALRVSLIPGLLANLAANRASFERNVGRKESALFEIGHVYGPGEGSWIPGVEEKIHLAAAIVGGRPTLDEVADALAQALGLDVLTLNNIVTEASKQQLKYRQDVAAFELQVTELVLRAEGQQAPPKTLAELQSQTDEAAQFAPIDKYPGVFRDISVLVAPSTSIDVIQAVIERAGGELVADVDLFDEYQPANQDRKGVAFHVEYRSPDRTLTDEEVNQIHGKVIIALESEVSAQIR